MVVGAWRWPIYEEAFSRALHSNGVETFSFSTSTFFKGFFGKYELGLPFRGPSLSALNRMLITQAECIQPDWILFWRPTHIVPTLRILRHRNKSCFL